MFANKQTPIQTSDNRDRLLLQASFLFRCFQFLYLLGKMIVQIVSRMEGWMRCHIKIFLVAFGNCIFCIIFCTFLPREESTQVLPVPLANSSVEQATFYVLFCTCFSLPYKEKCPRDRDSTDSREPTSPRWRVFVSRFYFLLVWVLLDCNEKNRNIKTESEQQNI